MSIGFTISRLAWSDPELGEIEMPTRPLRLLAGFGSGLARRRGDAPGTLWAVGDRGPNFKPKVAAERFGVERFASLELENGAKIMPRTDLGPAMAELRVHPDRVELVRSVRITGAEGRGISGLPVPEGLHAECEPALSLDGDVLPPEPSGVDSEGIAALAEGGFWIGDEYGPSLLRLDRDGRVETRWVPAGHERLFNGAGYRIEGRLPAIAANRQLNRGFEAIALSADERSLLLAFQSPLAHPDEDAHKRARHVRLWRLSLATGAVEAQYLYPLDPPESFRRDCAKGALDWSDLKVSEITVDGPDLLVLERGSETTKIYRVSLDRAHALTDEHLRLDTRPTLEESSANQSVELPVLAKRLVLSTDDAPDVAADLEGMAVLSPTELLLVNDNDFGVEGVETSFWRVAFDRPVFVGAD